MTKEEIINGLKFTVDMFLFDPYTGEVFTEPRNDMDKTTIDACRGAIEFLEQEPKPGHWIDHEIHIECNKCGTWFLKFHQIRKSYCPNCGTKMIESEV